jgi:imidazolonepropionase
MRTVLHGASAVLTIATDGKNCKRGEQLRDIGIMENHAIVIEAGKILDIIPNSSVRSGAYDFSIDVSGQTILPGLIDCHTHTIFAGNRADEFCQKLQGATYEDIARQGGGIKVTMEATRQATLESLIESAQKRINYFKSLGVTTVEIKSGYGLNFEDEIKMLTAIRELQATESVELVATFLGAHIVPPEYKADRQAYIRLLTEQLLPSIAKENLARFCDVFCEETAFSAAETAQIFTAAQAHGLYPKIHTEQFTGIGGIETALRFNAISADHLEVLQKEQIAQLAASETVCVLLPGVSFFLKHNYAPARALLDAGALVAHSKHPFHHAACRAADGNVN